MGDAEPTLWDIFIIVCSCNTSLIDLTTELKTIKEDIKLVRQYAEDKEMHFKGGFSVWDDDKEPIKRDLYKTQSQMSDHDAQLEDMKNRLCQNNVCIGIPKRAVGKNPCTFYRALIN